MIEEFKIVVAHDMNFGIGKNNSIPWKLKGDLARFSKITKETLNEGSTNAVIMGRLTYESIPEKFRPLPGRLNVVLTRDTTKEDTESTVYKSSLQEALDYCYANASVEKVFVIGGGQVYKEALFHPDCSELLVTLVGGVFECDSSMEFYLENYVMSDQSQEFKENNLTFQYVTFKKINTPIIT